MIYNNFTEKRNMNMTEYVGGDYNEDKSRNKFHFYSFISKVIQNNRDTLTPSNNLDKELKRNIRNLKRINLIKTRSDIEIEKYGTTSYPAFLWQEELENKFSYYAKIIGFIDGILEFYSESLEFYTEIKDITEVNKYKNIIKNYINKRNEVISDVEVTDIASDRKILLSTLKHYPSYEYFEKLYKYFRDDRHALNLHTNLVSAYNIGYNNSSKYKIDDVLNIHNELKEDLNNYRSKNIAMFSNKAVKIRSKKL